MKLDRDFIKEVQERSGQNICACYQCMKCFAGCPMSCYMDYKPNSLIRMVQYGEREKVLSSHAIWLCVSCMTCGVRCPNEVDMSEVMDTLREMSREAGLSYEAEKRVVLLHEEFVGSIRRLHEVTFFITYILRSLDLFSNIPSGLTLFAKGKLPMLPKWIKGVKGYRRIFDKVYDTGLPQEESKG